MLKSLQQEKRKKKGGVKLYEIVMEKREDHAYLITGNKKHFPKEAFIVTPKEMLEILDKTSLR